MKKIPCLFVREFEGNRIARITEVVTPGCEWVTSGEGVASRKRDGTACAVLGGRIYARYDAKAGKSPPPGAVPCTEAPDAVTGHWPHWVLVEDQPQFRWHREAVHRPLEDGTYELCGPKVQGNPEGFPMHILLRHGAERLPDAPRDFVGLRAFLETSVLEGIVFRHEDGRMAKIRRDDFGFKWPIR